MIDSICQWPSPLLSQCSGAESMTVIAGVRSAYVELFGIPSFPPTRRRRTRGWRYWNQQNEGIEDCLDLE